jgi:hypothetical protein
MRVLGEEIVAEELFHVSKDLFTDFLFGLKVLRGDHGGYFFLYAMPGLLLYLIVKVCLLIFL